MIRLLHRHPCLAHYPRSAAYPQAHPRRYLQPYHRQRALRRRAGRASRALRLLRGGGGGGGLRLLGAAGGLGGKLPLAILPGGAGALGLRI